MADPALINGKWTAPKDPDDVRFYKFGFAKDLTDSQTTIHPTKLPVAICAGVSLATHPDGVANIRVSGSDVIVYLGGLDLANNAANFCTVRLFCANGEQIDRTLWFVREDH